MRHMLTLSKNAKREDLEIKHYEGRLFQFPNCVKYFYNYYLDIIPHIKTYPLEMNNDRRFRNETYDTTDGFSFPFVYFLFYVATFKLRLNTEYISSR